MAEETGSPAGQESVALPADAPEAFDTSDRSRRLLQRVAVKRTTCRERGRTRDRRTGICSTRAGRRPSRRGSRRDRRSRSGRTAPHRATKVLEAKDDEKRSGMPSLRARQEKIAANERARELEIRQRTNELAEQRKATDVEHAKARDFTKALADKVPMMEAAVQEYMGRQYPEFKDV